MASIIIDGPQLEYFKSVVAEAVRGDHGEVNSLSLTVHYDDDGEHTGIAFQLNDDGPSTPVIGHAPVAKCPNCGRDML